jgi:sarcosine oxidase subunit beta
MKINVWFRQGGYLFLDALARRRRANLEASVALQNDCGLNTRHARRREAAEGRAELSTEGVVRASFNPDDGVVFPWPFVWGYARAARALGVAIETFTEAVGFDTATAGGRSRAPPSLVSMPTATRWSPRATPSP